MSLGNRTGDILTLVNVEYLSGFIANPSWRWVVFTDIGKDYRNNDVNLFKQNIRAGLGVRRKLELLSSTDIRLDVAWDPGQQKLTPYISTRVTYQSGRSGANALPCEALFSSVNFRRAGRPFIG